MLIVPLVALANKGYRVALVVVSSLSVIEEAGVAQVGVPEPAEVRTCPSAPAEVNA